MKITISLILFSFFLFHISSQAQSNSAEMDSIANFYLNELYSKHIDTIFIYKDCFLGKGYPSWHNDKCFDNEKYVETYSDIYFIWIKNGITYVSLMDNCFKYETVHLNADSIWNFIFQNSNSIKLDSIMPFQLVKYVNGEKLIAQVAIDHIEYEELIIYLNGVGYSKYIEETSFWKGVEPKSNINYVQNNNSVIKKLADISKAFIIDNRSEIALNKTRR